MSLIVDAKYKRHWEELQQGAWYEQNQALHERHREDLLQVLAYANLPNRGRRVQVWLTAVPMGVSASSVAAPFGDQIRNVGNLTVINT